MRDVLRFLAVAGGQKSFDKTGVGVNINFLDKRWHVFGLSVCLLQQALFFVVL